MGSASEWRAIQEDDCADKPGATLPGDTVNLARDMYNAVHNPLIGLAGIDIRGTKAAPEQIKEAA